MAATKTETIAIAPIRMTRMNIRIIGDSPLIMHAWSAKAKREILIKELGFPKAKARDVRDPIGDFCASAYWLTPMPEEFTMEAVNEALNNGARFGFPVTAFKQAACTAGFRLGWSKNITSLRPAFTIAADADGYFSGDLQVDMDAKKIDIIPNVFRNDPLVEIHSDPPIMREDMVRVGNGSADIRYRAEFRNWYADLKIDFNENGNFSKDMVVNLINAGGYVCGVGEWRPEKDGVFGTFHVKTD